MIPGVRPLDLGGQSTLLSLFVSPVTVGGGFTSTGTVILSDIADAGGATITLSSSDSHATVPATVVVPAGSVTANFTVTTTGVTTATPLTITGTYQGIVKTAALTITPTVFVFAYTVNQSNRNINSDALASGWDGVSPLQATINPGVVISSTSTSVPALRTGVIPTAIPLSIINNGVIVGEGGNGGAGATTFAGVPNDSPPAVAGSAGGPALAIDTFCAVTITNPGTIGGGGGGGGGACAQAFNDGHDGAGGGGGGGGYGGGLGGAGGTGTGYSSGTGAAPGGNGTVSSFGLGGQGNSSQGLLDFGGNGGDLGLPGGAGTSGGVVAYAFGLPPYISNGAPGGPAGPAIQLNSHAIPTFVSGSDSVHLRGLIS